VRSIELTFDEETESAVRADWRALAGAGLPSLARHSGPTNRPHLTLAAGDDLARGSSVGPEPPGLFRGGATPGVPLGPPDCEPAEAVEEAAVPPVDVALQGAFDTLPLPLRTSGLVVFGAPPRGLVLARLVTITRELLDLHSVVHGLAWGALPLTLPGRWTPHVTLALRLTPEQLAAALPLLGAHLDGSAVAARLWDSGPKAVVAL